MKVGGPGSLLGDNIDKTMSKTVTSLLFRRVSKTLEIFGVCLTDMHMLEKE
jgi:hypothetical protein